MKVIGIDPGLAMTGFGIVETLPRGGRACEWGTIRTTAESPLPLRLKTVYDELKKLLEEWRPGLLVMEDVFVLKQFPKAVIQLGEVRGVIHLAAQESETPVLEVRPTEVKRVRSDRKRTGRQRPGRENDPAYSEDRHPHSFQCTREIRLALALTGLSRSTNFRW